MNSTATYTELTNKPTIPTDISQLTDTTNKIGSGGGTTFVQGTGGGLIIAGDDSTQVTILPNNTLQVAGGTGITTAITDVAGTQRRRKSIGRTVRDHAAHVPQPCRGHREHLVLPLR